MDGEERKAIPSFRFRSGDVQSKQTGMRVEGGGGVTGDHMTQ